MIESTKHKTESNLNKVQLKHFDTVVVEETTRQQTTNNARTTN